MSGLTELAFGALIAIAVFAAGWWGGKKQDRRKVQKEIERVKKEARDARKYDGDAASAVERMRRYGGS